MIPEEKLQSVIARFEAVQSEMNSEVPRDRFVALSREFSELAPIAAAIGKLNAAQREYEDAEALLRVRDMAEMAREEITRLNEELPRLEHELQLMLLPKDAADEANIVLELRAGTGGDEAALFAGDLWRMYDRLCLDEGLESRSRFPPAKGKLAATRKSSQRSAVGACSPS